MEERYFEERLTSDNVNVNDNNPSMPVDTPASTLNGPVTNEMPMNPTARPGMGVGEPNNGANGGNSGSVPLINRLEAERFRMRWSEIQGKFVDEPRSAVQEADALVSDVVNQITQMFAQEHSSLESQWNQGSDVSTEDLRKALQRYRSFFNRLVG